MPVCELATMTWEEVGELELTGALAVLPVGALEAHGPHLPLDTDVVIARAMAREGAARLAEEGRTVLVLPAVTYTPAPFAAAFPGTVEVRPTTLSHLIRDIGASLARHGLRFLVLANAHLDPSHVAVLRDLARDPEPAATSGSTEAPNGAGDGTAVGEGEGARRIRIVFPDITRRRWAQRLTEEFRSGACHAGRYETSIVLAEAPDRVRDDVRRGLHPVDHSLSRAIRQGKRTFQEVGGPRAYFGAPAEATAEEGRRTVELLGRILVEATREALQGEPIHPEEP